MDLLALARIVLLSAVIAISSPNAVPITPAAGNTIYTVQNGDTLSSIARQFKTTADSLQQINHLSSADNLLPGEKLQVPAPPAATATAPAAASAAATYTVKSGDTLASIAASFGVSVSDIAQASGLQNVDAISVGQVLTIPGQSPALNPVPDGIALDPPIIKQGNTLEFKVTASSVVTATGTFNGRRLLFNQVNGTLFALAGISRCGQPGTYPANMTLTNADGTTKKLNFGVKVNATAYPVQDITLTPQMAALLDPAIEIAENNRVANTVTPFTVDMHEQLYRFKKGHRIMVQVQSTWFPIIDRNPQRFVPSIYQATAADYVRATHRVYGSARLPSHIVLPVVP